MREVLEELAVLQCLADDEATLLEDLTPILYINDVVLADVLDAGGPAAPAIPLVDLLRWAAASRTSRRAFAIMETAFADASDDEVVRLIRSADFPWVRDLMESVLTDLDGRAAAARSTIAGLMPAHVAPLLVDAVPYEWRAAGELPRASASLASCSQTRSNA
ncbi:hypothetical protein ACTOB_006508 [Actinoplanes oblitus]|uniref:Uncharacterized protein n=1 Tax=Actinoplanes oblitus TaxID=3040509 RepID=A0ABY8WDD5_9ACTN|nr:hypothetical protein [Actinoplanes oblitus]WIM94483.1 hypothetical protein ACTOB_006508 [Actinoplanes oblitus]